MTTITIQLNDDISRSKDYTYKKVVYDYDTIPVHTNEAIVFVTNTVSQIFDIQDCNIDWNFRTYSRKFVKDLDIEVNKCLVDNGYFGEELPHKVVAFMDDSKYYKNILVPEDNKPSLLLMLKDKMPHMMNVFKIVAASLNYLYYCDIYQKESHSVHYETTEDNIPIDEENMDAKISSVCSTIGTADIYKWHLDHFPHSTVQMILDIYYVLIHDSGMTAYDYLRHYDYFTAQLSCNLYMYMYLTRSIDGHIPRYITADIIDTLAFYKDIFGKFKTISVFNLLTQVIYPYATGLRGAIDSKGSKSELYIAPCDHVISKSKYTPLGICSVVAQLFTNRASNILSKKCDYDDYISAWDGKQTGKYFVEIPVIAKTISSLMDQSSVNGHYISPFIDHPIMLIFIVHYLKEVIPEDYPLFTGDKLASMMYTCKSLAYRQMLDNIDDYCTLNEIDFKPTNQSVDQYLALKTDGQIMSYTASKYDDLRYVTNKIMCSNGSFDVIKNIIIKLLGESKQ
jgi:hypothetical protein